jgi:hypothetical protein
MAFDYGYETKTDDPSFQPLGLLGWLKRAVTHQGDPHPAAQSRKQQPEDGCGSLLDRLDAEYQRRQRTMGATLLPEDAQGFAVHVLADDNSTFVDMMPWLMGQGLTETRRLSGVERLTDGTASSPGPSLLMIDIDTFPDTEEAIRALVGVRTRLPKLVVVAGSRSFMRHEFDSSRLSVSDVSLRLPATRAAVALAIGAAISNRRAARRLQRAP